MQCGPGVNMQIYIIVYYMTITGDTLACKQHYNA